ncbi:hypothetical protein GCT13_19010 [Paraburkholderia sp. CNPSo 3157]|uniref:Uncharacterized protein n=1 Tax=Paraburkholderia franconis TaxID=2654983 RepID=A0A7X1TGW5_9BURK|nr:hypothetical protein [Paraburkholderia franconis]MPW18930.1 hypothetical protein [Paraburkholderia franconis]
MKVADLIARLKEVPPESVVLLLPANGSESLIDELGQVYVPNREWTCERQYREDGKSTDYRHPFNTGMTYGFNVEKDEAWKERVVVLAPIDENLDQIFPDSDTVQSASALRDELREQAMHARRAMVESGELLPEANFRAALAVSESTLTAWIEKGSVFGIRVDDTVAYPRLFCDSRVNRKLLFKIARMLVPAPPDARLDFLTTRSGALGGRVPIKMLRKKRNYRRVRDFAAAWASEFSRTVVTFYEGDHEAPPPDVEALYTSAVEVDFRRPIWRRALKALTSFGYQWPHQVPSAPSSFTFFIERHMAGDIGFEVEAWLHFNQTRDTACVTVSKVETAPLVLHLNPFRGGQTVADVARAVLELLPTR